MNTFPCTYTGKVVCLWLIYHRQSILISTEHPGFFTPTQFTASLKFFTFIFSAYNKLYTLCINHSEKNYLECILKDSPNFYYLKYIVLVRILGKNPLSSVKKLLHSNLLDLFSKKWNFNTIYSTLKVTPPLTIWHGVG